MALVFVLTSVPTLLNTGNPAVNQALFFVVYIVGAILAAWIAARPLRPWYLGLYWGNTGTGRMAFAVIGATVLFNLLAYLFEKFVPGVGDSNQSVIKSLGFGETPLNDGLLVLSICVLAPLGEELIYRGLVFRSLRDGLLNLRWTWLKPQWAALLALLISAHFFMNAHGGGGQDSQLPMLFMLGVILALAYEYTGSLYAPILIHSLNNSFALAQGFWKGHELRPDQHWLYLLMLLGPVLTAGGMLLLGRMWPSKDTDSVQQSRI